MKPSSQPLSSEITPEALWLRRRDFLRTGALGATGLALSGCSNSVDANGNKTLPVAKSMEMAGGETLSTLEQITSYNNFYEFGLDKGDPAKYAHTLQTSPWNIQVEGECEAPGILSMDDLLSNYPLQERIYRLRCVEAWSMVVPWLGIPLGDILKTFKPLSSAKYVSFETLVDPKQMPGQKRNSLDWPYREGLRMDEAMHDLTLLTVGLYGQVLPKQNGAPVRLVIPWKYGFKSIKSIVKIRFTRTMPGTTWNARAPREYGFYANVNPAVSHPRWSQARERRIGELFKRETLPFNGYAEEVASLYKDMNLKVFF